MDDLFVELQNSKGSARQSKQNIGYMITSFKGDNISVDNYKGWGDTYERREQPLISDGKTIFEGTFEQLKNRLSQTITE